MEDNDLHLRLNIEDALFLKRLFYVAFYVLDDEDPYFEKVMKYIKVIEKYLKEVKR